MNPSHRTAGIFTTPAGFGVVTLLVALVVGPFAAAAEPQTPAPDPQAKWEKDIQAFELWDRKNSFPADAVLFVGSSSIRMWETRQCFPDLPVINRGFGGSQISEITPPPAKARRPSPTTTATLSAVFAKNSPTRPSTSCRSSPARPAGPCG
jgi:hypothetical protein